MVTMFSKKEGYALRDIKIIMVYNKNMKKFLIALSIFFSLAICYLLGSRMLQHGDFFYLSDQARDFTLVKSIVVDHKLTLIGSHSGLGGLFHGPLWLYILAPIFLIGNGNPLAFAYFYMTIPLITILVGFFVGKKLYGDLFSVLVAFFLAINGILWRYIDNTIGINVMPLVYILFLFNCVLYIRGKHNALIAATFFAGLAFQFETASAVALVPLVVAVAIFGRTKGLRLKTVILSIVSFIASLATFLLFDIRHRFLITTSTVQLFNQNQGHKDYITLFGRIADHFHAMIATYASVLFTPSLILLCLMFFMGLYFCMALFKKKQSKTLLREILFYFLSPAFVYLFYMFYPHPIYGEYVLDLTVSLIFALCLVYVTIWKDTVGKVFSGLFLLVTVISVGMFLRNTYMHPYVPDTSGGSYSNQNRVVAWIMQDAGNKPYGYFVYTPETFTYGMDYLFWWQSTLHHTQIPESKKLANTYVILYPPLANDRNAHAYWIEHTLHTTASATKTKVFTGGIIVEKMDMSNDAQPVDQNYYQNLIFR